MTKRQIINPYELSIYLDLIVKKMPDWMIASSYDISVQSVTRIISKQKKLIQEIEGYIDVIDARDKEIKEQTKTIIGLKREMRVLSEMTNKEDAFSYSKTLASKSDSNDNQEILRLRQALRKMNELFAQEYKTRH